MWIRVQFVSTETHLFSGHSRSTSVHGLNVDVVISRLLANYVLKTGELLCATAYDCGQLLECVHVHTRPEMRKIEINLAFWILSALPTLFFQYNVVASSDFTTS